MSQKQFPFNWFPQRVGTDLDLTHDDISNLNFHSIGFPSEWGHTKTLPCGTHVRMFPFNWFPQRVGTGRFTGTHIIG